MTTRKLYGLLILMNLLVLGVVFSHLYRSGAFIHLHAEHNPFFDRYKAVFSLAPFLVTLIYLVFNYFLGFRPRRGSDTLDGTDLES